MWRRWGRTVVDGDAGSYNMPRVAEASPSVRVWTSTRMPCMIEAPLKYPILLSLVAAVATIGLNSAAYFLTGSLGLLSNAVESLVNLVAAVTAYLSLHYAAKPVDESHTYGHEKIEFFSSGLEGVLISWRPAPSPGTPCIA